MTAIILAAGQGKRLKPYTNDRPKGLVDVAGKPLFSYTLSFLENLNIKKIIVVAGFESEKVRAWFTKHAPQTVVLINKNVTSGNLGTLMCALPHINDSFLLLNSDHIYNQEIANCIYPQLTGITAFCDKDRALTKDDMKVMAKNDHVNQISKKLTEYTHGYVGMTYVDKEMLPTYRSQATQLYDNSDDSSPVEQILAELTKNEPVKIGDISGIGWYEIDDEADLKKAEAALLLPTFTSAIESSTMRSL